MFRWLSRYVKRIDIYGVGIELREIPAEEAKLQPPALAAAAPAQESSETAPAPPDTIQREDYLCVSGTSASNTRTPRELDLLLDGEEIQFHIHNPGAAQARIWVDRQALQEALVRWKEGGQVGPITVAGRRVRKEASVVFVVDDAEEVEVQAGWWIWVPRQDLKAALEELGVRIPW
jgi:hypothetical protein